MFVRYWLLLRLLLLLLRLFADLHGGSGTGCDAPRSRLPCISRGINSILVSKNRKYLEHLVQIVFPNKSKFIQPFHSEINNNDENQRFSSA